MGPNPGGRLMRSTFVEINADASTVWRWLTVPELMSRWMHSIQELRADDGATLKLGSTLVFEARGREHMSTITEFVPREAMTLTSTQGPVTADYRYAIDESDDCCVVLLTIDCRTAGWARAIGPLIGLLAWLTDRGHVENLKRLVEAQA